jgi:DNA-binding NarL/FixJ family response regulator
MFTFREHEIIRLIALGLPSRVIADRLCVSTETIKSHRKNIISKIPLITNRETQLLEFAIAFEKERENHSKGGIYSD